MNVRRAVITAAGRDQRGLPLQTLVDRDGVEKKALTLILDEAAAAGAEEVCAVVAPGDEAAYREAAGPHGPRLQFVVQAEPKGYAHAVLCAREFVAGQAFLHLVGDHLYLSRGDRRAAEQVADLARAERCSVSAVQPTRETMLPYYGAVGGRRVPRRADLYEVGTVLEKPTPTEAEQVLSVSGLRAGFYLCFFGVHVLTPAVVDLLAEAVPAAAGGLPLSAVLAELARRERYLALEVEGSRYNIGVKYGLLAAQLALGLGGVDRDKILTQIVDLLAQRREETPHPNPLPESYSRSYPSVGFAFLRLSCDARARYWWTRRQSDQSRAASASGICAQTSRTRSFRTSGTLSGTRPAPPFPAAAAPAPGTE